MEILKLIKTVLKTLQNPISKFNFVTVYGREVIILSFQKVTKVQLTS